MFEKTVSPPTIRPQQDNTLLRVHPLSSRAGLHGVHIRERRESLPRTLCSSSGPDLLAPDPPGPPPSSTRTSTMDSSGLLRGLLLAGLLSVTCHGQASEEMSAEDIGVDRTEPTADRDLVGISTLLFMGRRFLHLVFQNKVLFLSDA